MASSTSFAIYRRYLPPVVDAAAWAVALILATFLRFDLDTNQAFKAGLVVAIIIAIAVQLSVGWFILYRWQWRIGSFEEIASLTAVVAIVTGVVLIASVLFLRADVPIGAAVAGGAFTLVLTAGGRCGWRVVQEFRLQNVTNAEGALVFGAGEAGRQLIDALLNTRDSPFYPVALFDDDPVKRNLQVRRLRVLGGREAIVDVARDTDARVLVVAIPSADSELIRQLSDLAAEANLDVRVLPPVAHLFGHPIGVTDIRPVTDTDLLGRHAVDTEVDTIAGYLTGKRVLVTGAGGSIGSELCRQIHRFAPAQLVMLDRDESGLHQVQLSIEGSAMLNTRNLVVCDIRDPETLQAVFTEHRPEVVFHAAALKHLPLLEMWPTEAVKTNVFGTLNMLEMARDFGVTRFVNISTDKAANPSSVLGYTKRIAERLTASVAEQSDQGTYLSVRFGNVLGSRGSVLVTFRAQIDAGGPVTVTDPEVTRYFMTVEEAVQLVIQAGAVGHTGDVLILDMGTPVRIADVAERLVREAPRPVRIVYTGLRPGEKLHEELFGEGEVDDRSLHPLISRSPVPPIAAAAVKTLDPDLPLESTVATVRALAFMPEPFLEPATPHVVTDPRPAFAATEPASARQPVASMSERSVS